MSFIGFQNHIGNKLEKLLKGAIIKYCQRFCAFGEVRTKVPVKKLIALYRKKIQK